MVICTCNFSQRLQDMGTSLMFAQYSNSVVRLAVQESKLDCNFIGLVSQLRVFASLIADLAVSCFCQPFLLSCFSFSKYPHAANFLHLSFTFYIYLELLTYHAFLLPAS